MRRPASASFWSLLALCLVLASTARADMEVRDPTGRRVLLKDDGTWKYVDDKAAGKPSEAAQLQLLRQTEDPSGCTYHFMLENTLPYEVRSLVPYFTISRTNGVAYATEGLGFGPIKPGDKSERSLRFGGIVCREITKVQVTGGDRCEMGDLNKFAETPGACLARVEVKASSVVKFEK